VIRLSYSQFNTWKACPYHWKVAYIDKVKTKTQNIHSLFGTALHITLQDYLTFYYNKTIRESNELNLHEMLLKNMLKEMEICETEGIENSITQAELMEFYEDGMKILTWFRKNVSLYFGKKNMVLHGCEIPLETDLGNGSQFIGKMDIVIEDRDQSVIKIIDFKKSYRGWHENAKKDLMKKGQLQLYKYMYSMQFGTPIKNIDIEFLILKQKVNELSEFANARKRVQKFEPPSGKIVLNKIFDEFMNFSNTVTKNGEYNVDIEYLPTPSKKSCEYCPFKNNKEICNVGV